MAIGAFEIDYAVQLSSLCEHSVGASCLLVDREGMAKHYRH